MANPNSEENILLEAKASEDEKAVSHEKQHLSDATLEASLSDEEDENAVSHKKQRLSDSLLEASLGDKASEDENPVSHKKQRLTDAPLEDSLSDKASGDESPVSHKKQSLSDAVSDAPSSDKGSYDSDLEEEEGITFYSDNIVTDEYGVEQSYNTDNEFLDLTPVNWREVDKYNLPEVYAVFVEGSRDTPRCLDLLNVIGCRKRFLGCSVELSRTFFAKLNKDEAARMSAVKGIRRVVRRRDCIFDI